ncbi:MAG: tRNA dihydrouridine synthase DusB [Planctomycetota bacterium]|nr:tRNA dihydrouridine synthase DusB [Planctomycetota bacterium]MDP6838456.1 tRNA dihydrouridine synthase DusB [Planctomycetota bacterium]
MQEEFAPLSLGSLKVWPPVLLAPMAGVTNPPFRALCRAAGAPLCVTEMVTARGYLMGNRRTREMTRPAPGERPHSIQVYGTDPRDLRKLAGILADEGVDHLDLNLGCPVPKITRQGGGSAICVRPRLVGRLVAALVEGVEEAGRQVPVTVKMRKGIDDDCLTYLDAARAAQEAGAAAVGLHGRTAAQLYSGLADWGAIAHLKQELSIPVLGNGDVWQGVDALRMMRRTGCDGVIVGRGCLGRPWIFRELAALFDGRPAPAEPNLGQVLEVLFDHGQRLIDHLGPATGLRQMRKWITWYTKGFPGCAALRGQLFGREAPPVSAGLDGLRELLGGLDPTAPYPPAALRVKRGKGSRTQRVRLPAGYLADRTSDRAHKECAAPRSDAELEAWEQNLSGG